MAYARDLHMFFDCKICRRDYRCKNDWVGDAISLNNYILKQISNGKWYVCQTESKC